MRGHSHDVVKSTPVRNEPPNTGDPSTAADLVVLSRPPRYSDGSVASGFCGTPIGPEPTRLELGRPPSAAQVLRSTCAALWSSLGSSRKRGPMISIVPEMPSSELAETTLSADARNSLALIVMLP